MIFYILYIVLPFRHRRIHGGQGGHAPQISSVLYHFVLWEAVCKTKYCCSLEVKRFAPEKFLGWLRHCVQIHSFSLLPHEGNSQLSGYVTIKFRVHLNFCVHLQIKRFAYSCWQGPIGGSGHFEARVHMRSQKSYSLKWSVRSYL